MTQILLDVTRLLSRLLRGQHPTGVDRVGLAYIQHYGARARAVISERGYFAVMSARHSYDVFSALTSLSPSRFVIRKAIAATLLAQLRPSQHSPSFLLHTSHNGMEFGRYYRSMRERQAKCVFLVHDLIPITHAEYCRANVDAAHRLRIHTALQNATGLIANSSDTLNALATEAIRLGVELPPTVVARLAPGIEGRQVCASPIEEPYFVMLGTIEPRKNHWFMLHVWRRLVEQLGSSAPKLVIIGRRGWECENVVDMLERCEPLKGAVIEESACSDQQLQAWLQHAKALLFPSFVEGYGMPLVEALMLKTPVIASDLPVFHEIAGDIPDYLDPLDGPGWLEKIQEYARPDSAERVAQIIRIEYFEEPTWAQHFESVDRFIDSLSK